MEKIFKKNICCIGAGYVGGPTMSVIALNCPDYRIDVVDVNKERINSWNNIDLSKLPIFEPGLDKVVENCRGKNLFFSTNIKESISNADIVFISVNTPTKLKGIGANYASDLSWIEASARQIAKYSRNHTVVVEKSTLPVKTAETIKTILNSSKEDNTNKKTIKGNKTFSIISNPEFLAEGSAISDLQNPDRVLIGGEDTESINLIADIYKHWVDSKRIITTNLWSSELSKLVANAFLAQRISSINSLSELCEETGADIEEVSKAIGMDSRIGSSFLKTSVGFGGSCFKKDILNLVYIARSQGLEKVANYWEQILVINAHQRDRFSKKIIDCIEKNNLEPKVLLLGLAFKKDTNDTRESAAIYVANNLLNSKIEIGVFDPKVNINQIQFDLSDLNENYDKTLVKFIQDPVSNISNYNLIAIMTEWDEFKEFDWQYIYSKIKKPAFIFDGRNILNIEKIKKLGFNYTGLGRK